MFGGPGKWLHTYVGGMTNQGTGNGFEHVLFAPPAVLIAQALAPPAKIAADTTSAPLTWSTATREGPHGTIALFWSVESGKLAIQATAPPNSIGTTAVPLLGASAATVTITEGGAPVWSKGAYVPGAIGITGANATDVAINIQHGSGTYFFEM